MRPIHLIWSSIFHLVYVVHSQNEVQKLQQPTADEFSDLLPNCSQNLKYLCNISESISKLYCKKTCQQNNLASIEDENFDILTDLQPAKEKTKVGLDVCMAKGQTVSYDGSYCCNSISGMELTCGNTILTDKSKTMGRSKRLLEGFVEESTIVERWPWVVSFDVESKNKNATASGTRICTGALISTDFVLFPADCFDPKNPTNSIKKPLYLGKSGNQNQDLSSQQENFIGNLWLHPDYDFPNFNVALVKLQNRVKVTKYVSPICLPNGSGPSDDDVCVSLGYTRSNLGIGNEDSLLVENDLTKQKCADRKDFELLEKPLNMSICAGQNLKKIDFFLSRLKSDDSNKQNKQNNQILLCQRKCSCSWYLSGLSSSVQTLDSQIFSGVFTDLTGFQPWIMQISKITREKSCNSDGCKDFIPNDNTEKTEKPSIDCSNVRCDNPLLSSLISKYCPRTCEYCVDDSLSSSQQQTWSSWTTWSDCVKKCGEPVTKSRSRSCQNTDVKKCRGGQHFERINCSDNEKSTELECAEQCCQRAVFSWDLPNQESRKGLYLLENYMSNDRPVYRKYDDFEYVYYYKNKKNPNANPLYLIGSKVDASSGGAFTAEKNYCPYKAKKWTMWFNGKWNRVNNRVTTYCEECCDFVRVTNLASDNYNDVGKVKSNQTQVKNYLGIYKKLNEINDNGMTVIYQKQENNNERRARARERRQRFLGW